MASKILAAASLCVVAGMMAPVAAAAQSVRFDIPAQDLATALQAFAAASGREVVAASDTIRGKRSAAVAGLLDPAAALAALVAPTGLRVELVDGALVIRAPGSASARGATGDAEAGEVVVTGSRIRGAAAAATTITVTRDEMTQAGQSELAALVRSLPQNFTGGQNPGIGFNVPEGSGADVGGGASFNLRGLGSDATLTLLNGRRLSYSGPSQSIDVSAIPLGAIARVDVVPDGASALFGSDAVGGVVNLILRRDLDGLEASGRIAGSTDGGNVQQQYAATGGVHWAGGNALLAYEHGHSSAIEARQRSYARRRTPGLTLYPELGHDSVVGSVRQSLGAALRIEVDGGYNQRRSNAVYPLNDAGDLTVSRGTNVTRARAFFVAPALIWHAPADWRVALAGSYGGDAVDYGGELFIGTTRIDPGSGTYRSRARAIELSGDGPLFALPAGPAKLALGAGYRRNAFARITSEGVTQDVERAQRSYYAFAELRLPLLARSAADRAERLTASAAARYERYPGIGDVVTPKLGLIFAPTAAIALKGTWGRSFRAPTLYQQYQPSLAYLFRAGSLGATGQSAGATALLIAGGNATLQPERSTNWSVALGVQPQAIPGLALELSYFAVRYRDRIVTPIPSFSVALATSAYAAQVTPQPSAAAQAGVIAQAAAFRNLSGSGYDPARVIAVVDNRSVNAGRQHAHGLDALARYRASVGATQLTATVNASYLASDQRISAAQPTTRLAGRLFGPPHWRARGELGASRGPVGIVAAVSYLGPVVDARETVPVRVAGMTPLDATLCYAGPRGRRALDGVSVLLSLQNLLNDKPTPIATSLFYDTPYDSTNAAPFGRVVSLTVQKSW